MKTLDELMQLECDAFEQWVRTRRQDDYALLVKRHKAVKNHPDYGHRRDNAAREAIVRYARGQ